MGPNGWAKLILDLTQTDEAAALGILLHKYEESSRSNLLLVIFSDFMPNWEEQF